MAEAMSILFVLGPSGSGKTTLGLRLAEDLDFLHLEIDRWPDGNGIDLEGLRTTWDSFWTGALADELSTAITARAHAAGRRGAIVTFPSGVVFGQKHLAAAKRAGILTVVLYGTAAECLTEFLRRENESGRCLDANHWILNNAHSYAEFSRPTYAEYRLSVFHDGRFRDHAALVEEVRSRLETR